MAPKGNAKATAAREAKAGREADKKGAANAVKEQAEAEKWGTGAKKEKGGDKQAAAAEKAAAKAAAKAQLEEEEAATSGPKKAAPKAGNKSVPAKKPTPVSATTSAKSSLPGTPRANDIPSFEDAMNAPVDSFSASNIDDALDMLSLVNERSDKAAVGARAAIALDSHPERRYKAAFAAYKERELPQLRKDQPGMRLQQYEEIMYKDFKKSPENPFNQQTVAFNATKEEKVEALKKMRTETENRLRDSK